jgi:hypothetical protein
LQLQADDDLDEPQQPNSAPLPFKRESPPPHDAQLFAKLTANGVLTSPPRRRALSPSGVASPIAPEPGPHSNEMQGGGSKSRSRGGEQEDESLARVGFLPSRLGDAVGSLHTSKIPSPSPSKPPRLPSAGSLRQGQSPQKRNGSSDPGKQVVQPEQDGLEHEGKRPRVGEDTTGQKPTKPVAQKMEQSHAQTGGGASTGEGGVSLRGGPRLRAEGLMAPPAADAASLRRQVAALQVELEAHIEGEGRLQSINNQLRER